MHFIFSYDLNVEAGVRRNEIESKILASLPKNNYTRQLNNFYIVRCNDNQEWQDILHKLVEISKSIPEILHFIMSSPTTISERYNGILPRESWNCINDLTKEDSDE